MSDARIETLKKLIRDVPDFPKPGIVFKDITPLLGESHAFRSTISLLSEKTRGLDADLIAGPEARGFIFGCPLAVKLGIGFVPIRKRGKLPWQTIEETYALEYGEDSVQMHEDAIRPGQKVLLVDDLLATGGTMAACRRLVEKAGGIVVGQVFLIELSFLEGRAQLGATAPIIALIEY